MIIINVTDLPGGHVIDQGGGIWGGMSGSPVYVDGKLLGAVSWGFTRRSVAHRWSDAGRRHGRPARPARTPAARRTPGGHRRP